MRGEGIYRGADPRLSDATQASETKKSRGESVASTRDVYRDAFSGAVWSSEDAESGPRHRLQIVNRGVQYLKGVENLLHGRAGANSHRAGVDSHRCGDTVGRGGEGRAAAADASSEGARRAMAAAATGAEK
eukprot:8299432-Pyramimonas_sp.AAC.1